MTMRLRMTRAPITRPPVRNNRHIACRQEDARLPGLCYDGKDLGTAWRHQRSAPTARPGRPARHRRPPAHPAGHRRAHIVRGALRRAVRPARRGPADEPGPMYRLMMRWRDIGYAATGQLGPGPSWCWLTRNGMAATGLGFPATRPALTRLAHIRAVLAARLWLEARPAWTQGQAWWHSERRLKAGQLPPVRRAASTCPTRRSTGPASTAVGTPDRCGPSRSS